MTLFCLCQNLNEYFLKEIPSLGLSSVEQNNWYNFLRKKMKKLKKNNF